MTGRQRTRRLQARAYPPPPTHRRQDPWRSLLERRSLRLASLALLFAVAAAAGAVAGVVAGGRLPALGKSAGTPTVAQRLAVPWPATPPASPEGAGQIGPGERSTDGPALVVTFPTARFRELLALDGLDALDPTDSELAEFGQVLCLIASLEDVDGFASYRDRLATQHGTNVVAGGRGPSPTDVAAAVDAGLIAFCPDEAVRLGVTG